MVLARVLTHAAAGVDRVVARALLTRSARARSRSKAESLGHDARMAALGAIRSLYDRPEYFDDDATFFPAPSVTPAVRRVRTETYRAGGEDGRGKGAALEATVLDLAWTSTTAYHPEVDPHFDHPENRSAAARVFRGVGDAPRPAVVLVHGYRAGQFAVEERVWPISWLLRRGFDVALFVLPFHGVRAPKGRGPMFPSSDPRVTNEGYRQAIADLRVVRSWFLASGAPDVGLMGMSLGGYTTALAATLDEWSFAVPLIPFVSIADMAMRGGRFVGTEAEQRAQHEALEAVHRVVSPLARAPRVPRERVMVIAAEGDQVTTVPQARRLAEHFGVPLELVVGGHILQFGRGRAFKLVGKMFSRLRLGAPRL